MDTLCLLVRQNHKNHRKLTFLGALDSEKTHLSDGIFVFSVSRPRQNLHTQSIFCDDILLSLRCVLTFQVASFCKSTITSYLNILESGHENCIEWCILIQSSQYLELSNLGFLGGCYKQKWFVFEKMGVVFVHSWSLDCVPTVELSAHVCVYITERDIHENPSIGY